ncbi:hypothetical protein [Halobacillus ihumii]|uniref:hypothetical protein n=1 Tax=Halobacillus ihumii TaxID=2686092 RepID=UPI0013CF766A|nr:hypothetical protein [Halobacillus ihumii]
MLKFIESKTEQTKQFERFLVKRQQTSPRTSKFMGYQIQDFLESGMTPKAYLAAIEENEREFETFLSTFRHYHEFIANQYFDGLHKKRWEVCAKYAKGGEK